MGKLKSYFKVLITSLNPVKAKKYFLAFDTGKSLGFLFITMTLLWIMFFYITGGLLYVKAVNSSQLKEKLITITTKILEGSTRIVKEIPFTSIAWDAQNQKLKVLGLTQPYVINFYANEACTLDNYVNAYIKKSSNAMFVSCGLHNFLDVYSPTDLLKKKPIVGSYINTTKGVVYLESVENRMPGYIDFVLTANYLSIGVQESVSSPHYKERKIFFQDLADDATSNISFFITKEQLIQLMDSFYSKIPGFTNELFKTILPALLHVYVTVVAPILLLIVVFISVFPMTSFVGYFNFLGSLLLATLIGMLFARLNRFNKTNSTFAGNLPLGALATTTVYMYRASVFTVLFGVGLGFNSHALILWAWKIFTNSVMIIIGLVVVMWILKNQAVLEILHKENKE